MLIWRKGKGALIHVAPREGRVGFCMSHTRVRGAEAGARGRKNCHIWVTISSTAGTTGGYKQHTCAAHPIVSGCFLLGTCPHHPQLHRRGTAASYATAVKSNRMLVKVRPQGTRLNYLPARAGSPSSTAKGQAHGPL